MKTRQLTLLMFLCCVGILYAQTGNSLTFTEVMFRPAESNGEFIEIYNTSATETINLTGFKIKYYTSNSDNLTAFIGGLQLGPGKYAVVIENDYDFNNGAYMNLIPAGVIILKTADNSFGTSGMSNTSIRDINLINGLNQTVDTYIYTANNNEGYSDEKVIADKNNSAENWKNSLTLHGTPGYANSVSPTDYDLSTDYVTQIPALAKAGETFKQTWRIKNEGRLAAGSFILEIFYDSNGNESADVNEVILTKNYDSLPAGDSLNAEVDFLPQQPGNYRFIAFVQFALDQKNSNNIAIHETVVYEKQSLYNEIVVNEIMYAPAGDEPEWIELYNKSDRSINLLNWKIGDNTAMVTISSADYILEPAKFLVISKESSINNFYDITSGLLVRSIPSISNSGDDVILKDIYGAVIDSVKYSPTWGGSNGRSLERIDALSSSLDAANWGTSLSGVKGTPGKTNSLSQKQNDLAITSIKSNITGYILVGTDLILSIEVENRGLLNAPSFILRFYHDANLDGVGDQSEILNQRIYTDFAAGSKFTNTVNYPNVKQGRNIFIARIDYEADEFIENNALYFEVNGIVINASRTDIVINEIMYWPSAGEPEWIELYNQSGKEIDLKKFRIYDEASGTAITNGEYKLADNDYVVVSRDTTIRSVYSNLSKLLIVPIPSLNNTGDMVVLSDSLGRVIDSLHYKSSWGGTSGKSLERRLAGLASTDSTNWQSTSAESGTPAYRNSITQKELDAGVTSIQFDPPYPFFGSAVSISAEAYNYGLMTASFRLNLYRVNKDNVEIFLEVSPPLSLLPGQSGKIDFDYRIASLDESITFTVRIDMDSDENSTNNSLTAAVSPGYAAGTILINEIMYNPLNGEPEWIELYNTSSYNVDFSDWTISDILTTPVKSRIGKIILTPQSYLVVAKDSSVINFHAAIPSGLVIIRFASLNNDEDGVVVKDSRGVTIDSVRYKKDWGGLSGRSIERKSFSAGSNDKSGWGSSADIELSTPGRLNSIILKNHDLLVKSVTTNPPSPSIEEVVKVAAKILNAGYFDAAQFKAEYFTVEETTETKFAEKFIAGLAAGDSITIESPGTIVMGKSKKITVRILYDADEDLSNNILSLEIKAGYKRGSLLVTEIMFNPLDNEPEWIEIYNNTGDEINLKNWYAADLLPAETRALIVNKDSHLPAGSYGVIAVDTSKFAFVPPANFYQAKFGSLSNTADGVAIYDFRGALIDSVQYDYKWGGEKGVSLERLSFSQSGADSSNWRSSLNHYGATPGFENSYSIVPAYGKGDLVINEIMYEPESGYCEFVEFYNTTSDSIQIGGMKLIIGANNEILLAKEIVKIPPGGFYTIAADSSIYKNFSYLLPDDKNVVLNYKVSLSNEGAMLRLKDYRPATIDSLTYSPDWHNRNLISKKNRSLERLNPLIGSNERTNWSSSVNQAGSSPGKINSVYTIREVTESKISISPNPFSPDNDGFEDFAAINFDLSQKLAQVRIKVYNSMGRLVRTLIQNNPAASNNTVLFDGTDDEGRALRIGIYVLVVDVTNQSGSTETFKAPIVVARKL